MNLPSKNFKIKVGPHIYDVIYSIDVSQQSNSYGSANNFKFKIYLDNSVPRSRQEETFIHEVVHALFSCSGLSDRVEESCKHPAQEEELTNVLSIWMYQFIQDNANLFK